MPSGKRKSQKKGAKKGDSRKEPVPQFWICSYCGKESFRSRKDALKMLDRRRLGAAKANKGGENPVEAPKYVYRCEGTGDYHASKGEWKRLHPNAPKKTSGIRIVHNFLKK